MIIHYEPTAEQEVAEASLYYENVSVGVAEHFPTSFDAAVEHIFVHPRAWPPLGDHQRRRLQTDFPHQIVYEIKAADIRVYAFAHLSRRPNYWRKCLRPKGS